MTEPRALEAPAVPVWQPMLFGALAGGMAWGIRGQYGHETGAMMAGLAVGLVMALIFCPNGNVRQVARAVAWCTVAMGLGGSMTYGQTVGLTHDAELVGNWSALRWGMLGLAIKGGLWIGFGGAFLGTGLSGVRYHVGELLFVWLGVLGLCVCGIWLFNEPFDPANRILPKLYFSDSWQWEPNAALKPRREVWGGFLLGLAGLLTYLGVNRRDGLARRLGLWGVLGGAIGFPLGQSLQAYHAWNLEFFRSAEWVNVDKVINWWNFMETTFGAVMGAMIGLGLWLNRRRIAVTGGDGESVMPPFAEWSLIVVHCGLLVGTEFFSVGWIDLLYDFGLMLGFIPLMAIAGGRWWPWLVMLPITALPIAGKTLRELVYKQHAMEPTLGWLVYLVVPMAACVWMAVYFARRTAKLREAQEFLRPVVLLTTWLYFGLNYAFFQFPWPWEKWTSRTPNAIIYTLCAIGLTWLALRGGHRQSER